MKKATLGTTLSRWDARLFELERVVAGAMLVAMGAVIFADVVHRVFSRAPGRLAVLMSSVAQSFGGLLTPAQADTFWAPAVSFLALLSLASSGVGVRFPKLGRSKKWAFALGVSLVVSVGVVLFVRLLPAGLVWAPYLGLSLLLWSGLIGASMASYQGSHLSLEMGEKLWPKKWRPSVARFTALVVGLFCATLAVLGATSVMDHYQDWMSAPGAGLIPSIEWPKWVVFMVVPYAFGVMSLRALGRASGVLRNHDSSGPLNSVLPGVES